MFSELSMAASSVQSLSTLLKAANKLANYNEMVAALSEINAKLAAANSVALASQEKQATLTQQISTLEKEIADLKAWDAERERYALTNIGMGAFAYAVKESMANGEPPHWLCVNCYNQSKKSVLHSQQEVTKVGMATAHICPRCSNKIIDVTMSRDGPQYA